MKVEKKTAVGERQVVIGCAVTRSVLAAVASRWEPHLFPSRWANLVVGWCVEHYQRYKRPPGKDLTTYFDAWASTTRDKDLIELVESFLLSLSQEHDHIKKTLSPEYLIDVASNLFEGTKLLDLSARITSHMESGEVIKARELVENSRRVELGTGSWLAAGEAEADVLGAFEQQSEVLIQYPDALGNFFDHSLERDGLIAIMAGEKKGKSYVLLDMAWTAVEQSRRVAYFEVGDQSKNQLLRRLGVRAAGRPLRGDPDHAVRLPVEIESPLRENSPPEVKYKTRVFPDDLDGKTAMEAIRKVTGTHDGGGLLRISVHPNSSISVVGIENILERWVTDGWSPDVTIIDYADILAPIETRSETRDQINATWKALRRLTQRFHCLCVTATQADAGSYTTKLLRRANFSEDKRKYSHVTGVVGLNQTDKEKEEGIYRLNWVMQRDLPWGEGKCVYVASCLALGRPFCASTF